MAAQRAPGPSEDPEAQRSEAQAVAARGSGGVETPEGPPRSRAGSRRLVGVDAARGLALLGMMAVHVLPSVEPDGSTATAYLIAGGCSAAAFAVLAGVGLALATGGPSPLRGRGLAAASAGIAVRALLIGAIGLALGSLDSGVAVILAYYGVLFVLAVPLLGLTAGWLAGIAAVTALVVPFVSHAVRAGIPEPFLDNATFADVVERPGELLTGLLLTGYYPALAWVAYISAGLAIGRLPLGRPRVAAAVAVGGAALALLATRVSAFLLGNLGGMEALAAETGIPAGQLETSLTQSLYGTTPTGTWWWLATDAPHSSTSLDLLHTIGTSMLAIGALSLLVQLARAAATLLLPLAAAGAMTLTLYTAHVVLLASDLLPEDPMTSYVVQVLAALAAATVWRLAVGRGPLETLVTELTRPVRRMLLSTG